MLKEGVLGNTVEECKVESSEYECIGLDDMDKRSLMKMRNRVGDTTQHSGTPLFIGWVWETDPSNITERDLLES